MPYRQLTASELETLAREHAAFQNWRVYAAFAIDVYGCAAERIEARICVECDDGRFSTIVETVDVYNAAGALLEPDLSTDWWQHVLDKRDPDDYAEDWLAAALNERRAQLPPLERDQTFCVSRPPLYNLPAIYVAAEG